MLQLSDYLVTAELRAVLGVNDDELSDSTLALDVYPRHLEIELRAIDNNLPTLFTTLLSASPPTADEEMLILLIKQSAVYIVAMCVADALPVFSPRSITDGKAGMIRHQESYKETIDRLSSRLSVTVERLRTALKTYNAVTAAVSMPTLVSVSTPDYDPVTG